MERYWPFAWLPATNYWPLALKPVTSIRDPPTDVGNRDRRQQCPPDRQGEIGQQAEQNETTPENFSFHCLHCMPSFHFEAQTYKTVPCRGQPKRLLISSMLGWLETELCS
jgi:hypothetical protein